MTAFRRQFMLMAAPVVLIGPLLLGCARTASTTTADAGPSSPGAPATSATPAAPGTRTSAAAIAPSDFVSNANVKDVYFDFDRDKIRKGDAAILDKNASWLKSNAQYALLIEGHCDERGTTEYNLALGDRRAKAAMSYLVARGVPASRIAMVTYGEDRPVCREHAEDCWAKNRRDHVLVKAQ